MKKFKNWIPAFAGMTLILLSSCSGSKTRLKLGKTDQGEVVEAEGFSPYDPKDMINTKRGSLVDAQRNAVEKAVGVFVSGKTMVEKAVAIENNILARTDGYVKKYDILSEIPENGLYRTKIRALVALKDLEADLKGMSLLTTPELRRPRVSVILDEEVEQEESDEKVAANALKQSLIDQGFTIVTDERAADAELNIKGKVASFPFQAEGLGGFVSYRARLSLQILRAGTDDVVLSYTKEASGLGGTKNLAGFKSLETVANLAGSEIGTKLTDLAMKGGNLLVIVEGVKSFADVDRVKKHLASQPSVKDLMVRVYDNEMVQFEVQVSSERIEDLASHLEASQSLPLKVVESKNQILRLQFNSEQK